MTLLVCALYGRRLGNASFVLSTKIPPFFARRQSVDLAALFEALEQSKHELGVLAYSLCQATNLERVFIALAKSQT